ncbi:MULTISPECIES: hypothetical protein [unclassified Streptomyces]|uniref:hypothetical protein n=1 Tax=unclassified Streptomyces TaxID=2593676 RepID=UPI002DD9FBA1|nr:hypothetical protein [Streptomyces sp. NBC_01750]WSA99096.1 hypothetical protein OIE54_07395 [Streptomyces sp. NBC_01794]WSD36339.1 hypothetical protein OG966_33180 [Streptomyces sp. NBC_01750]
MSTTHDFDFLHGEWAVANRRLADFLDESSAWEEFPAVSRASRHFGGRANFDEIEFPTRGFRGLTLRLYDAEREEWSLYWSNDRTGVLFPPVVGRFGADGRGEFYGDDTHDGKDVRVRFTWSGISESAARWEQAFSVDGERTWMTNWVMELSRPAHFAV